MKKEDFIQIFPKEAEAIKHSPNVPFQGTIGLPCNNVVPECWILFLEDDEEAHLLNFERNLQALINQDDFKNVKGLVIGRFQKASKVTREELEFILKNKPELHNMPIIANIDMGHTTPINTIALGGHAEIEDGRIFIED